MPDLNLEENSVVRIIRASDNDFLVVIAHNSFDKAHGAT